MKLCFWKNDERPAGNTFSTLDIGPDGLAGLSTTDFTIQVLAKLAAIKKNRDDFYRGQRESNQFWVNFARRFLAITGAAALLLTALASGLRFLDPPNFKDWDKYVLVAALAIYALMGAVALYERGTDRTSAYFRHLAINLGIRDLWNNLQLAILKELPELQNAQDPKVARARVCDLAKAFCTDLDKMVADELNEWRTEFMASLKELDEVASKGRADVHDRLEALAKAATQAAKDAKDAAALMEAAARPGMINLTVSGAFEGDLVVALDGDKKSTGPGKTVALPGIPVGPHIVSVDGADKNGKALRAAKAIDVKAGIQDLTIAL